MAGQTVEISENNLLTAIKKAYKYYDLSLLSFIVYKFLVYVIFYVLPISEGVIVALKGISFLILIWFFISVYKLAYLLKQNTKDRTHPALWVVLMAIPLFNMIGMLMLYHKSRKLIKSIK